jgi:DNA-binding LacI/PurR family transcriptional regulator
MATIYDVAKLARVSTYTVSSALNNTAKVSPTLTRRVLKAAADLDYTINRVASSLQTRRSTTIGMLIPDIANPFYAKVVRGVEDVCRDRGYSLLLGNTYNKAAEQARYVSVFRSRQVDGILMFVAAGSESDLEPLLKRRSPPIVFVGRQPRFRKALSVVADNRFGTGLAVDHLIKRGHRRIAILTGELALSASQDRVKGWKESLQAASLTAPNSYIKGGDWSTECAREQTLELLSMKRAPTAIFAASLPILVGVLHGIRSAGLKVPQDMEVMSSDDSDWLDVFDPPISVVLQPSYQMGAEAIKLLLGQLSDPPASAGSIVLKPKLKLRC